MLLRDAAPAVAEKAKLAVVSNGKQHQAVMEQSALSSHPIRTERKLNFWRLLIKKHTVIAAAGWA